MRDIAAPAEPLLGLAALMRRVFAGEDVAPLTTRLLDRANADPDDADALMDLSTLLQLKFKPEIGLALQSQALEVRQLYRLPARQTERIRLLALMGPGDLTTNAPLDFLLEDADVSLEMLYLLPDRPFPDRVPDHDLAFVAVGESARSRPLLERIDAFVAAWPRPLLNRPDRIVRTSRENACALLADAPGLVMPISVRAAREAIAAVARGERPVADLLPDTDFPVIIRPLDSHAGHGLARAESPAELADYLAAAPEDEFHLAPFVDYRSPDDRYRKYRIVVVDSRPYAGHMAISKHWMVHYLNADMEDNPANRDEEARFMADFDTGFGLRHGAALAEIDTRIGLDYLVIDCAEMPDGRLLVFEIDSGAVVHGMDPVDKYPYKQPQMRKVFAAFRRMLDDALARAAGA